VKSLLARLLLVMAVALVPSLGFQAYLETEARGIRQRQVEDEALRIGRLVNAEQQQIVEGAEQVLNAIGGSPAVQDNLPEQCNRLLVNLLQQSPRYTTVTVIGLDGHILCSPLPFDRGIDLSDRAHFRRALQTGGFAIGEYTVGRVSGKPSLQMAKPFRNRDGIVAGVVDVSLSLDWLGERLKKLPLPPGAAVSVRDRNGTFLARYPEGPGYVGSALPTSSFFTSHGSDFRVAEMKGVDGIPRLVAYAPIGVEPEGLRVFVGLDREVTFAAVTQQNRLGLLLIVAGVGLALVLTALVGRHVVRRPLDRLLAVADRWRTGDFAARTGLREDGSEFGRLAGAFDRMAAAQVARESALRESETRLQLAREAAGFGVWDWDLATNAVVWSDEQWRLHGREPQPGGGATEMWNASLHPEDGKRVRTEVAAALADPTRPIDSEYRVVLPDGTVRWLLAKGTVVRGAGGEAIRMVGLNMDVTARRETEATLRGLTEDLAARVRETEALVVRVREEVAAREAAQAVAAHAERLQALGQLAGGIAHDFNNVLQAVEGAATLIERRPRDEVAVRRLARLANEAVGRGASITRRLLAFGRRGDLRAEALDAVDLLSGLREILTHTLGANIEVHVRLAANLPPLLADKGQLETVLVNLATNARDAMPKGGRLTISAESAMVSIDGSAHPFGLAPGRYVRFAVADTGVGMDAATLARAGEPFFTTKGPGLGTGLGLPMARGFAEQSGGALDIDSSPGEGTAVTLWLPELGSDRSPDTAVPPGTTDETASGPGNATISTRLLVVDDEAIVREVLAQNLGNEGFGVLTAASGTEALALIAAGEAVDALVTDLSMPGMDGLALIRAAQERRPGLPAVLLTGYAGEDAALALGGAVTGAFSLLRKPVRIQELVDRVQALLASIDGDRTHSHP